MNLSEVAKLVGLAIANYPNMQDKEMRPTAKLWQMMLSDVSYEVGEKALAKVLTTARFFPTIAEIREAIAEIEDEEFPNLSGGEAWARVMYILNDYGLCRYSEAEDFYNAKSKLSIAELKTLQAVGGFIALAESENIDVLRGQYMKIYENIAKREREDAMIPDFIKALPGKGSLKVIEGGKD